MKQMTNLRRLIHDTDIKGWRCTACGWAWPLPRFLPAEQDGFLVCQQDFEKHKCLKHPRSSEKAEVAVLVGRTVTVTES